MRTIYKYTIPVDGQEHLLSLPQYTMIVNVDKHPKRSDAVSAWALIYDTNMPHESRTFIVSGTGQPVDPDWSYIGSAVTLDGSLVWHLWETYNGSE